MKKIFIMLSVILAVFAFNSTSFADSSANAVAGQTQGQSNVNAGVGSSIVGTSTTTRQSQGQTAVGLGGGGGAGGNSNIGIGSESFSPESSFEIKDSFNGSINRQFAIPGQVLFPIAPAYFGAPTPGNQFIPLAKLTQYTTEWNMAKIGFILNDKSGWFGDGMDPEVRAYVDRDSVSTLADKIIVTATQPANADTIEEVGVAEVVITNDGGLSIDAFAKILKEAQKLADVAPSDELHEVKVVVQFLAEGVLRKMHATGFGIGISFTGATMSTGQKLGTMSTGGTGWSTGTSGYKDRPWLQALVLKVEVPTGTALKFKAPTAPRDAGVEAQVSKIQSRLDKLETNNNVDNAVKAKVANQ